jgi:uncharacterized membrane protein
VNLGSLLPLILASHIILAVSLFLPAFLLPFTLRTRGRDGDPVMPDATGRATRVLLWLERNGTVLLGAGVAATGFAMLVILGGALLAQPWLLVALALYASILAVSFFVQRPGLRRLLGLRAAATEEEKERWRGRARAQRYISYLMAAGVGLIGWLMMAKPGA